ncbi:hypothetical protein T484DRAFT_3645653 [Baffinella frigidus]|nr:hypothetical protein T484DRAFT_3645653 [Cryptophyta sp. CCMP2293]
MAPHPPPANWDPKSILIQKRMLVSGFGITTALDLKSKIVLYQWKFAAGMNKDGSEKTAQAHKDRRDRYWDHERARLARLKDENDRTPEEKDAIFKADHPGAYQKSRVGNSNGPQIIPPPPDCSWARERSHLSKEEFDEAWMYAGGEDKNGNYKSATAHTDKRGSIRWDHKVLVAMSKNECDRSPAERAVIEKEEARKLDAKEYDAAYVLKRAAEKLEITHALVKENNIRIVEKIRNAKDAFDFAFNLFDDKDSEYGKLIFETLDGMTLREAFWDGKSDRAMYILASRGMGDVGRSDAESIRFLVKNSGSATTVLTHMDGTDFKYRDPAFKKLEHVYCPVGVFESYGDCTAVEAALQLIFNFLEVGSKRLWLQSGIGFDSRPLRGRDIRFIKKMQEDGGYQKDNQLVFVCGITILKNVEVLSRGEDINGKDIVTSIKAGSGTTCRVHQPKQGKPVCNIEQTAALVATLQRLGPNFMDLNRKRKAGVLGQDTTYEDDGGIEVNEIDECERTDGSESMSDCECEN